MTAALLNTAIALPPYIHSQEQFRLAARTWLAHDPERAAKADAVLLNAQVDRRYTVRPMDWYLAHPDLDERSAVYQEEMIRLCEQAAREALDGAGVPPEAVGLIISTSCTGLIIPSVEAYLMNRMPFRSETRRQPLTALGCAAGAAAVSQAANYLRAYPEQAVLIISAELASLTAQIKDFSMANVVSVSLFGDGAAATVAVGPRFDGHGRPAYGTGFNGAQGADGKPADGNAAPNGGAVTSTAGRRPARVIATRSVLFPDSQDLMGFDLTKGGLKIFLLPKVPRFLRSELPKHLLPFLEEHGLRVRDLKHFLLHPGGRKVLEGLQDKLELSPEQTRFSWRVLREYGNLSSATVLFVLHHFEREVQPAAGDYGLMAAVGPGFSAELVLLQW